MSTFVRSGITALITGGGFNGTGSTDLIYEDNNGNTFPEVGGDGKITQPTGFFNRSGSVVPPQGVTIEQDIEADGDTSLEFLRYQDTDTNQDYFRISGGGASSITNGTLVTIKTGSLDAINDGIAEIILNGISSVSFTAEILDGSGTVLSSQGISMSWTGGGDDHFKADSDVTFNNGTGNPWSIEEVRVEVGAGLVLSDTGISTSVADGGSITFTTIEQNVTNLSAGV